MKIWVVAVLVCTALELGTAAVVPVEDGNELENLPLTKEVNELDVEENIVVAAEDEEHATGEANAVAERAVYCPSGWISYRSRCIQLVRSSVSWISAENHCVSQRGSLISVKDPDEYNFLQNLLSMAGLTSNVWIGAYNFQNTWLWIDRSGFYYSNWYSLSSVSSSPCAYMRYNLGWANTNCGSAYPFFCSFNPSTC